jgi:hypothetical protein
LCHCDAWFPPRIGINIAESLSSNYDRPVEATCKLRENLRDLSRNVDNPNSNYRSRGATVSIQTARRRLAEQIRAAIQTDNSRSPTNLEELDRVTEQWRATPETRDDRMLDDAYHSFLHFLTDRDIRSRDPKYAENQISAMRQLIEKLERPPSSDQI